MPLFSRLKAAFNVQRWMQSSMRIVSGGGEAARQPFSYEAAVRANRSWIYAAASLNAQAVASQPLRLYVRSRGAGAVKLWNTRKPGQATLKRFAGETEHNPSRYVMQKAAEFGDDYEVVTEAHPVLTLLDQPNPYQNGYEATMLRVLYQELTGNAYLHPVMDKARQVPAQLWSMPSQYVEIVPGKERFIDAYLYGVSRDQRRIFAPDEVIHFKRPNPGDLYYGLGKLEAAWGVANMNAAMKEMDLSFFENKARPDYLLTIKSNASQEEIERLEVQIDDKLRGKGRTGRFLTATADIDLKPMNFPPKDLGGREDIVEEIAAVFGVPVSMLKANDPNLASATVGFQSWKAISVLPLLRLDEQTLNAQLLPLFGIEEDAFLAYDSPVMEDEKFAFEKRRASVAGGILTANEARKSEGLEPIEDPMADRLLINGQPLGGPAPAPAPALPLGASIQTDTAAPEQKDALSDCVSEKIPKLIDEGYDRDQAIAIAYSMCEGKSLEDALAALPMEPRAKALSDIDTKPPQTVADNARRALEVRARKPESERGMTAVGIARARDLANRVSLSEDTIRRMLAYFERHEVDKEGETWDEQGKGWQAWNGWGGDDGFAWARRKVEQFDRERERKAARKSCGCGCSADSIFAAKMESKDCGTGAGGFQPGNTCGEEEGGGGDDSDSPDTNDPNDPSTWEEVEAATGSSEERAINMMQGVMRHHPEIESFDPMPFDTLTRPKDGYEISTANFYSHLGDSYVNGMLRGETAISVLDGAVASANSEDDPDARMVSELDVAGTLVQRIAEIESQQQIHDTGKRGRQDPRIDAALAAIGRGIDEDDPTAAYDAVKEIEPILEERKAKLVEIASRNLRDDGAAVEVMRGIDISADAETDFGGQLWTAVTQQQKIRNSQGTFTEKVNVEELEFSGMVSTTVDKRVAQKFAVNDTVADDDDTKSVILKIRAKRGIAMYADASRYAESEVLLPPGKFRVVSRDVVKNEDRTSQVGILVLEQL
jgi:HK97 family phage portal protein